MGERRFAVAGTLALLACLAAGLAPGTSRAADAKDPAVRVPDGVQASPVASVMITRPDAQCPAMASFRRDSISYTEWANNVAVSNWTNTSDTFLGCVDADPNGADPNAETPPQLAP